MYCTQNIYVICLSNYFTTLTTSMRFGEGCDKTALNYGLPTVNTFISRPIRKQVLEITMYLSITIESQSKSTILVCGVVSC